MKRFVMPAFGLERLTIESVDALFPATVRSAWMCAFSLNYRDLMVVKGHYNPRLRLPATPVSDAAGVVTAVGPGVSRVRVGDRVMTHYVAPWLSGPFRGEYLSGTLGTPGPGFAAEQVIVGAEALLAIPAGYDFADAATLPVAALTAWSALVTEGRVAAEQTVLTLGTGGVSIFALQLARRTARVIITSSSDDKLARARALGADHTINSRTTPDWEKAVLELTGGAGVDITVENAGGESLERSIKATRSGGMIALLGVLGGVKAEISAVTVLMKRLRVQGILVDSREAFESLCRFVERHAIRPVIDRRFRFEQFRRRRWMESGGHFGKIVVQMSGV